MRLVLACVGRLKAGAERELVTRYFDRARATGRAVGLTQMDMTEVSESSARRPDDRMAEEGEALLSPFAPPARLYALDPRGRNVSSEELARLIAEAREAAVPALGFLIGGADGLSEKVRARASGLLAFGTATFPHQLVRVMLAEQVYRATTILTGHPYHRA